MSDIQLILEQTLGATQTHEEEQKLRCVAKQYKDCHFYFMTVCLAEIVQKQSYKDKR